MFGANVKSLNFPQENISSLEHTVGLNSLDRSVSWGRKKNPAPSHLASWLCLASRERLMKTLIRSVSMASSRLLERPEKILLIQGVEVPVDGVGEGKGWILLAQMCRDTHKQAAGERGENEQRLSSFTRLGTSILLREREPGTFKIRHLHMGRRACKPSVVEISETDP